MFAKFDKNRPTRGVLTAAVVGVGFCALMAVFDESFELTRRQLSIRLAGISAHETGGVPGLSVPDSEEPDQAQLPLLTFLPGRISIAIRRVEHPRIEIVREFVASDPEHWVVLPGTPPPFLA